MSDTFDKMTAVEDYLREVFPDRPYAILLQDDTNEVHVRGNMGESDMAQVFKAAAEHIETEGVKLTDGGNDNAPPQ